MLAAIQSTTLLDDVYEEDLTTNDLEAHCAALTGKEAGLFVLSGTMGNQVALRSLLKQPPYSVLCDHRSHINKYEAGGYVCLSSSVESHGLTPSQCRILIRRYAQDRCTKERHPSDIGGCPGERRPR